MQQVVAAVVVGLTTSVYFKQQILAALKASQLVQGVLVVMAGLVADLTVKVPPIQLLVLEQNN